MPKPSVISDINAVKALTRVGFFINHETGSHKIVRKE
ncbi:MAG: type II toxin-antitoxin system HicA family toxin [Thermoplasmataceae archaeon]